MVVFASNVTFQEAINIFQNSQPIGGWAFYAIALIIAMIAGGWMMRYSVDGAGLAVIAVLWFFTFFNPNACMLPLNSGNAFDPSMVYGSAAIANGVICITPFVATVFTTIATLSALFLVRYL